MKRITLRSGAPLFVWKSLKQTAYNVTRRHGASLGLPLAVGATLRLIWPNDALFVYDQADMLDLGRSAIAHHALILTGITSSIAAQNPPISAWFYAPFSLLGDQAPLGATILTALFNILAIALTYAIATHHGGRLAGCVAALLYGTASGSVHYSRFMWQQNLLAPFLLLLLGAVLAGLIEQRAYWLGWAVMFWGIAVQLHSTTGFLLTVIVFAAVMSWRRLRRGDIMWAGAALVVLFSPVLVWELVSHGADIESYYLLSTLKPVYDLAAPYNYASLIAPAPPNWYGAGSSYAPVGSALAFLGPVMEILALAAGIWLASVVIAPWLSGRRAPGGTRASLADPRWKLAATLLIWQVVPVMMLIRHPVGIPEHYLLLLTPIIYLSIGLWAAATSRAIDQWLAQRKAEMTRRSSRSSISSVALVALTIGLATAQTIGVAAELETVHSGQFVGTAFPLTYGIPLSSLESALRVAKRSAITRHASLAIASTQLEQDSFAYLAQTDNASATTYVSDGCVVVPTRASGQSWLTLALPGTRAASAVPLLTGVRSLGSLRVQGSAPLAFYLMQPGAAPTNERELPATTITSFPYPSAYSYTTITAGDAYLTVRWSGAPTSAPPYPENSNQRPIYWFGSTAHGPVVTNYVVTAQQIDAVGQPIGAPLTAKCDRLSWQAGTDLLAWLPLPIVPPTGVAMWRISLSAAPVHGFNPSVGPLALETGDVTFMTPHIIAGPFTLVARPSGAG